MTLDSSRSSDRAESAGDRRNFLVKTAVLPAVAIGASVFPLSSLLSMAGAADGETVAPEIEATLFLSSIESALIALYEQAGASNKFGAAEAELAETCRDHHVEHAKALGEMLTAAGATPPSAGNDGLMTTYGPLVDAAADQTALIAIFADLEEALAATHLSSMKVINSAAISGTVGSILPVESQHAALWNTAATPGEPPSLDLVTPLQTAAAQLSESTYRVSAPTTTGAPS